MPQAPHTPLTVAAVHAASELLALEASVDMACALIGGEHEPRLPAPPSAG